MATTKRETEMYVETLRYVLAVTEWLNSNSLPDQQDYYLKVQLVEAGSHKVAGSWSDEIAPDCWSFAWDWEEDK